MWYRIHSNLLPGMSVPPNYRLRDSGFGTLLASPASMGAVAGAWSMEDRRARSASGLRGAQITIMLDMGYDNLELR